MISRMQNFLGLSFQKRLILRLMALFKQPIFWTVTVFGNTMVVTAAYLFYIFEFGINPHVHSFLDCLHWSVGLVTTIGYGEVMPVTDSAKILAICLMVGGAIFLWTYMALFVSALVSTETVVLESEIRELERKLELITQQLDQRQDSSNS